MYLADTAIKRPVFATMVILALVVLGLASFFKMNVELFPNVDFPFVVVMTVYPGASSEAVATDVTKKIEDVVNTIAGIKRIISYSRESLSQIIIEFSLETDPDVAAQDVRDKIAGIAADLPRDAEAPIIQKYDPASQPIITITVSGDRSEKELTGFAKNFLKRHLETVPGVGSVEIIGGSEREIQILLDLYKINALDITPDEVAAAVSMANLELPGGKLNQGQTDLMVRVMGRASSPEELSRIIVRNSNGKIIRLQDVADVVDGVKERNGLSRLNGNPAISMALIRQSGANIVATAEGIKKKLKEIERDIPSGVKTEIVEDNSIFIRESIDDVVVNLIYGGLLAVFVIFLFLANVRSTIISALAIPTSIISTLFLMNAFGFSINMMTLLGLSLAVGLLIDDAIVVIENIYRHLDSGEKPMAAARNATAEIGLAVMATTFSIMVVFIPVAFMSGIIGRFFYQFGITVAGAVLVSLFVAFTLTPMLSSRWLKKEEQIGPPKPGIINIPGNAVKFILRNWHRFFKNLDGRYRTTLQWVLNHRLATLAMATFLFLIALGAGKFIGSEFLPQTDQAQLVVTFKASPDESLDYTASLAARIEEKLKKHPEVVSILTRIGGSNRNVNEGDIFVKLVPKNKRAKTVFQLIPEIRKDLSTIAGLSVQVATERNEGGGEQQIEYSIRGPDHEVVRRLANEVEDLLRRAPGAVDILNSEKQGRPELQIHVDRDIANDLGLSIGAIAGTVRNLIDGVDVSRLKENDEEYNIRLMLDPKYRRNIDDLSQIKIFSVKNMKGEKSHFELGNVASLKFASSPADVRRYDRQRSASVGCNLAEGYVLSDVSDFITANLSQINIPPGYKIEIVGAGEIMAESFSNIFMALILAIIFIYLLLASQFESFIDPLAIMLSLPLAVVGALLLLLVWRSTFSIMSLIGIVLLMGLVTKNAILLIDLTKQLRRKGIPRTEALLTAGPIRLRPILMTTFAMIFGALPLAFGLGPGAEFRAPMARAIIGGLISSTLLTLVVVPVVYSILDDMLKRLTGRETVAVEIPEDADEGAALKTRTAIN